MGRPFMFHIECMELLADQTGPKRGFTYYYNLLLMIGQGDISARESANRRIWRETLCLTVCTTLFYNPLPEKNRKDR
jgi:hypothetical protein